MNRNNNVVTPNELRIEITQMRVKPRPSTISKQQVDPRHNLIDRLLARANNLRADNERMRTELLHESLAVEDILREVEVLNGDARAFQYDLDEVHKLRHELVPNARTPPSFLALQDIVRENAKRVKNIGL